MIILESRFEMLSRVFGHILGSVEADAVVENERCDELLEFEDDEWVIIDIQGELLWLLNQ